MTQQPFFDVENVVGPLRQVRALQPLEDLGIAAQGAADGVFGRVVPVADHLLQVAAEPGVLEHLQVGLEDGAVLLPQLAGDRVAVAADLDPGGADRLVQPLQLVVHRVAGNEAPGDAKALGVHHQRFADGDAGGNGNSL